MKRVLVVVAEAFSRGFSSAFTAQGQAGEAMQGFQGKVALITGAASGIGRASTLAFARAGAHVVAVDVDEAGLHGTLSLLSSSDTKALAITADVTRESEVSSLVARTLSHFGALHFAHNNAGMLGPVGDVTSLAEAAFDRVIALNLKAVYLCLKHEIPALLSSGGGAIVNTSSGSGLVGTPNLSAYAASKHGVVGLTKSVALEVARRGVRVNAVCPGVTHTAMLEGFMGDDAAVKARVMESNPSGRLGTPDEVAAAVLFLCSEQASFINGACLSVDGGAVAR